MVFLVGNKDYSAHVIAGSYEVNNDPQYKEWEDASYISHKLKLRDRVQGSFDMWFRTVEEYEEFKADLDAVKANEAYTISLTVNNTSEQANIYAYLDFKLVRNIDGAWNDYFERFTVTVKER